MTPSAAMAAISLQRIIITIKLACEKRLSEIKSRYPKCHRDSLVDPFLEEIQPEAEQKTFNMKLLRGQSARGTMISFR